MPKVHALNRELLASYYLSAKSVGSISRNELIEDMVRNTSLTKQEASTAVDYLFDPVPGFPDPGFTVKPGDIGYFKVTLRSEGSKTPEEATPDKIKGKYLRFIPGKAMRGLVKNFSVEKLK